MEEVQNPVEKEKVNEEKEKRKREDRERRQFEKEGTGKCKEEKRIRKHEKMRVSEEERERGTRDYLGAREIDQPISRLSKRSTPISSTEKRTILVIFFIVRLISLQITKAEGLSQ